RVPNTESDHDFLTRNSVRLCPAFSAAVIQRAGLPRPLQVSPVFAFLFIAGTLPRFPPLPPRPPLPPPVSALRNSPIETPCRFIRLAMVPNVLLRRDNFSACTSST